MASGILGDTIDEVKKRISSLLSGANTSEIQGHLRNIKEVVVRVEHTNNAENKSLRDWLAMVKDSVNDLVDVMPNQEDLVRSPSSRPASWMKRLTRSSTQDQILSKIKDATSKLNKLAEPYTEDVTKLVGEANNKETGSKNLYEGYHELSFHQKQCFAYCSLFPKGYEFDVPRLIYLWTAEGFLSFTEPDPAGSTAEPEDRGQNFASAFVGKKIFQDQKKDEIGRIKSCKLNPQMHDLAALIARDENMSMDPDEVKVPEGLRRVSFDYSLDISRGIPDSLFEKAKKLWTILLSDVNRSRRPNEVKMNDTTCQKIFSSFKDLYVLDLHNLGIKSIIHSSVGDLKYLHYLDLSENNFEQIPSSITKLTNLKTLKLSHCLVLKELPKDLKELKGLRHLEIEGCLTLTHMPTGMEKITSLRTLSNFVVSDGRTGASLKELTGLIKLTGDLEIVRLEQLKLKAPGENCLQHNKNLYGLTLRWDHDNDYKNKLSDSDKKDKIPLQLERLRPHDELKILFIVGYLGKQLQNWLSSLNYLVKFSLYNCPSCDNIPPLHTLPSLKILILQRLDSLQYIDCTEPTDPNFSNGFFESLEKLSLWDCPMLTSWWKPAHIKATFPRISELEVRYCPELTRMPLFPRLDKKLVLVSSAGEPLKTTIEDGTSSTSPPLSHLKSVLIANIEKESPEAWIGNFTSLEDFHIRDCPLLQSLPSKHFNNLKSLVVENCAELNLPDEAAWNGLKSLRSLTVRGIPKLNSLPPEFGELTSLEYLELHGCHELTSLSNGFDKLTSLSKLVLSKCEKLASLPTEIKEFKYLDTLIIKNCPLLLPRCQRDIGDDWPNISHIKKIDLT